MRNPKLTIQIGKNAVEVHHKSGMVNLDQLIAAGNTYRVGNNQPPVYKANLLRAVGLEQFRAAVVEDIEEGAYAYFEVPDELIKTIGKTKSASTYAFLPIALKIASMMDSKFEAQVYRTFIEGQMLQMRDSGGENFKALNRAIDTYLPDRQGKDNKSIYIDVAIAVNNKILGYGLSMGWSHALVTAQHHEKRKKIEVDLTTMLSLGVIRDYNHLKEIIERL